MDSVVLPIKNVSPLIGSVSEKTKSYFRVQEIAYGLGGPSENMLALINVLLQNSNLVSVLSKICPNFAGHVLQD